MSSEPEHVELLLEQMQLHEPSKRLDQAIADLASEARVGGADLSNEDVSKASVQPRFGWSSLISTAIVAALAGVLLGQWLTGNPSPTNSLASGAVAADSSGKTSLVNFNPQAFEMLHGHSAQSEFSNCDACHDSEDAEAFDGWFYGDEEFFEKHQFVEFSNCTKCHRFDAQPRDASLREHEQFKGIDCSTCHVVGMNNATSPL